MHKYCPKCNENKTIDCFLKDLKKKDGLSYYCKPCRSIYYKKYRTENKDKVSTGCKKWYKLNKTVTSEKRKTTYCNNREDICVKNRKKYKNDPLRFKNYDLKKTYGITLDDYNRMLEKQNNCCAICTKHKDNFTKALAVDHCHKTGKIRGLLCINCNRALGNLKDSIENIKNTLTYLEYHYDSAII